ncbi:P-TEFb-associated cyclin-dependent protein kinase Cdk9, partial [Halocaridina rubra]
TLYSDNANLAAGVQIRKKLEDTLAVLQQRALLNNRKLRIEKLSTEEERHVQQLILQQLQLGQLSEKKGNVQDLEKLLNVSDQHYPYYKNAFSDSDSSNTVTLKPRVRGCSPNSSGSVRPKSSQRTFAQAPKSCKTTMNIAETCAINSGNQESRDKESSIVKTVCNPNNLDDVASTSSKSTRKEKVFKGPSILRGSCSDDLSPLGQVSNQDSPVFNVSMIKELQTSPMQVTGEPFVDKLREKGDYLPCSTQQLRSSSLESTPVSSFLLKDVKPKNSGVRSLLNGEAGSFHLESLNGKEKLCKVGNMSGTKENSPHVASISDKQIFPAAPSAQSSSTSKSQQHRKCQIFSAESQDSGDIDIVCVSNSDSDNRLNNLHETSSLEVELPSSHEENSSSHDSDESPLVSYQHKLQQSTSSEGNRDTSSDEAEKGDNHVATEDDPNIPKRPLVRARTFEVFQPLVDDASNVDIDSATKRDILKSKKEEISEPGSAGIYVSTHHVNFHSSKRTDDPSRERSTLDQGKERKKSDEAMTLYYENMVEDPEKLREMERKKGSLIFEHNFQTYSNIPTTNMMTASMMTASISSESSMGVGSLYSSMMDSALLGSIHSLGGLEPPVVDPIPRPASVGLPIMHTLEEPVCVGNVVAPQPPLKDQRSTEEMAYELQQEIAQRGQGTRSPSPDSLSIDIAVKRDLESQQRDGHAEEAPMTAMDTSTSSLNKEEMDNEEKEKDDRENESKSSESSHSEGKDDSRIGAYSESQFNSITSIKGSPRLARASSENTPIVSGGSTLKREKDTGDLMPIPKCDRQVSSSSIKDIDSIPLVFGYVGPQDEEETQKPMKERKHSSSGEGDDDKHPQSIFPMFIDLNEIPTPSVEKTSETEKKAALKAKSQSSGVYMYIEADTPSPKTRRKRKSESDGAVAPELSEQQVEGECSSLPPVLPKQTSMDTPKLFKKVEENNECLDQAESKDKDKKGFFMFIEAESSSKTSSPKLKRRQVPPPKKKSESSNVMTRSAPSDSLLFSSPESSSKLMTKSVIDRDEFIAQPPTRKNVSLNDKINESSTSRDGAFVSGIPRPIHMYKSKSPKAGVAKIKSSSLRRDSSSQRESSVSKMRDEQPSETTNDMATSRDISISELGPSQSMSVSDALSTSLPREAEISEVSDVSSLLSSIDRSNDPSDQGGSEPCSRLGEDLLRMFLNEINTDVTIQIGEKRIRAHKCILASRCVYFAAMLSGHWVESAGNIIKLQGFSADSVMVALKHIYSGSSTVPENVRVGELAALADMLALDGLKDVIALHLKAKMCHYFHKPCSGCLEGVLDVLPIAGAYCLDELYHRCLRWVAKHFVVVLPTRNYAALPPEVQDRCLKQLLDDMSVSNVIDTALGCERVLSSLPMVRWAQPVFDSAAQLLEATTSFIAANLSGVLASDRFIALGKDSGWSIDSLEDTMRVACELIRPDQAVLSHVQLTKLLEHNQDDALMEVSEGFISFLENLLNQVEKFMIHNANRVAVCRKWPMLSGSTQRRIKDAALVVVEFSRPVGPKPRLSSSGR